MRMNLNMAGIYHEPFEIRRVNQLLQKTLPDAFVSPTAKSTLRVFPVTVTRRQVLPRGSRSQNPENGIQKSPVIFGNTAPGACPARQMRLQQSPGIIRYIVPLARMQNPFQLSYLRGIGLSPHFLTRDDTI